ncbi:MAG: cytochrome c oxidase subunit II [Halorientalis sp.]
MHVHKYEKLWLLASLLLIVGFISTIVYGAVGAGVKMVDDSGGQVNASNLQNNPQFSDPGVKQVGPHEYEVYVVAQQFIYTPDTIEIPANSTVTFYVTSQDVIHGFEVAGTNVNTMVIPGQVSKETVRFDEPAKYGIVCNEYCGSGHHTMSGQLIVRKPSNFTLAPGTTGAGNDTTATTANGSDSA